MENECFLRAWGNRFHDGIEAPRLADIIRQNYGVRSNAEIVAMLRDALATPPPDADDGPDVNR